MQQKGPQDKQPGSMQEAPRMFSKRPILLGAEDAPSLPPGALQSGERPLSQTEAWGRVLGWRHPGEA